MDFIKDIIYITKEDDLRRRQVQTVLYKHLDALITLMTPILPHTTYEANNLFKDELVFLNDFPEAGNLKDDALVAKYEKLLAIRNDVNKAIDANTSVIGIYATHDIVLASGLIGAFLTIDAASLLGKSSVGNDDQWVKDAGALRDLLRVTRTLKSDPKEVITIEWVNNCRIV